MRTKLWILTAASTAAILAAPMAAFAGVPICPVPAAPELDPSMAVAGLALAGGVMAYLAEGVRRRKAK